MSRGADIAYQMQQRRIERKKPKVHAMLKKVSIDRGQQREIVAASGDKPAPMTVQKTGGRNSLALTFSIGLHALLAILVTAFYITQHIENEAETFDADLVVLRNQKPRTPNMRQPERFRPQRQEIKSTVPQAPVTTAAQIPNTYNGPTLPPSDVSDVNVPEAQTTQGPSAVDIGSRIPRPTQPTQEVFTPKVEAPRTSETLGGKLDDVGLGGAPGLSDLPGFQPKEGTILPRVKLRIKPDYPKQAKDAEKEGVVELLATIDVNGVPTDIQANTKLGFGLEQAAIEALRKTKYIPAKKNGKAIKLRVLIKFDFKLEDY